MTDQKPRDTEARLVRIQAISGTLFALFLLLHLANQAIAVLGPRAYDETQRALRAGYQLLPVEIGLVMAPLLVHAGAGIVRMVRRRRSGRRAPANARARLHRWSGIVLLVFAFGHVVATRGASLFYDAPPEFAGIVFTLKWVPAYFWPYYTVFALAGLYHTVHGLAVALPMLGLRVPRLRRLVPPLVAVGSVALVLAMLAFGGVLFDVGAPGASPYAAMLEHLGFASPDARQAAGME